MTQFTFEMPKGRHKMQVRQEKKYSLLRGDTRKHFKTTKQMTRASFSKIGHFNM